MMKHMGIRAISVMLLLFAAAGLSVVWAKSGAELLEEGIYAEQIEGDLQKAIGLYDQVIEAEHGKRGHVAKAMYHKGMCYMMLNRESQAQATFEVLIHEFKEQTRLIARAQKILAELTILDPASIMPADTVFYVELGVAEQDVVSLLRTISSVGENVGMDPGAKAMLSTLFTDDSSNDITLAAGFIMPESKKSEPGYVLFAQPGERSTAWSLIRTGMAMAGKPEKPIGSLDVLSIDGHTWVAYDKKMLIFSHKRTLLEETVKRYQGENPGGSLALKPEFLESADKQCRQGNLLTLWCDIDSGFAQALDLEPAQKADVQKVNQMVNIEGVKDLMLELNLEEDRLVVDLSAHLKEGYDSPLFQMIQTPLLSEKDYAVVPEEAVGILSLGLTRENLAAVAQYSDIDDIPVWGLLLELSDCVDQINLFAVPVQEDSANDPFAGLGLAMTCHDAERAEEIIGQLLVTGSSLMNSDGQEANSELLVHRRIGDACVVAFNPSVIELCEEALDSDDSVLDSDLLRDALKPLVGDANKVLVANAGGVLQLIRPMVMSEVMPKHREELSEGLDELDAQIESTMLQLYTREDDRSLRITLRIEDLPEVEELILATSKVQKAGQKNRRARQRIEARARRHDRLMRSKQNATVISPVAQPIVLDGEIDEGWGCARRLNLQQLRGTKIEDPADFQPSVRVAYDTDYLYVLFEVIDDNVVGQVMGRKFWNNDGVEIFVDADNGKTDRYGSDDYQFYAAWKNGVPAYGEPKRRANDIAEWAMVKTPSGYVAEARLPWRKLNVDPKDGTFVGIETYVSETDDGQQREAIFSWSDHQKQAAQSPGAFGTICLKQRPPLEKITVETRQETQRERSAKEAIVVRPVEQSIVLDGSVDSLWAGACEVPLFQVEGPTITDNADFHPSVRVTYDDRNLYVLFEVIDDLVTGTSSQFWNNDCVEIFIDPANEKSWERSRSGYQFYATWWDGQPLYGDSHHRAHHVAQWVMKKTSTGYVAEAQLPWDELKVTPEDGTLIGIEFYVSEIDEGQKREAVYSWRKHPQKNYASPALFGTICLNKNLWKENEAEQ